MSYIFEWYFDDSEEFSISRRPQSFTWFDFFITRKSNKHLASAWLFRIELLAARLTQQKSDPQGRIVSLVETRIFQHGMAIARNFPNAAYSIIEPNISEYRVLSSNQLSLFATWADDLPTQKATWNGRSSLGGRRCGRFPRAAGRGWRPCYRLSNSAPFVGK